MAFLRLSDGRIYTTFEDINRFVAPLEVGAFALDPEVRQKVAAFAQPLSQADALYVLDNFPKEDFDWSEAQGYTHRRVGAVIPSPKEDGSFLMALRDRTTPEDVESFVLSEKEIADYLTPHHVLVNDVHFVYSGAIVKGVWISEDLQGVVYCPAGEWIRLGPTILNWPIFPWGEATVAISCFDQPCEKPFDLDLKPDVPIKPTMMF